MPTAYADPDVETPEPTDTPVQQAVCGSTPCWSPTPMDFTTAVNGRVVTVTPDFKGNVTIDWGDGSADTTARGVQTHTYAAAGTFSIGNRKSVV